MQLTPLYLMVCFFGKSIHRFFNVHPKLLDTCLQIIEIPKTPHLVILGSPDISKRFFGYVLLLHLARLGTTVICERGKDKKRYLFFPNSIMIGNLTHHHPYLIMAGTFYVVDVAAKTILLLRSVICLVQG